MKKFKTVCLASLISLLSLTAIFSTIKPTSGNASTPTTTQEESTAAERPLSDKPGKEYYAPIYNISFLFPSRI